MFSLRQVALYEWLGADCGGASRPPPWGRKGRESVSGHGTSMSTTRNRGIRHRGARYRVTKRTGRWTRTRSTGHFLAALILVLTTVAATLTGQVPAIAQTAAGSLPAPQDASGQPAPVAASRTPDIRPPDSGSSAKAAQNTAMQAAVATAQKSGRPTVISGLTTETEQVTANPKGDYTFTETLGPVRTQHQGTWVPIDTTLRRNANGTYSPAAVAYGTVVFSGGGTGPMASTTSGTTTFALSWPTPLPTPTVHGDQATYANVLPSVDLVLTANAAGGFSDVLVVHTAAAAKNPALATLTFPVHVTGGRLATTPGGGLQITPTGTGRNLIVSTPAVWDSNTTLSAAAPHGATTPNAIPAVAADPSDIAHAGLAAHQAPMPIRITGSAVSMLPSPALLTGLSSVFPLYIDPTVQWSTANGSGLDFAEVKQGGVCHGSSFVNGNNTDGEPMGVGFNHWTSTPNNCIGVQRAYYQWTLPTNLLAGATIAQATVNMAKEYSASCINSTDYLHLAGALPTANGNPYVSWDNQPGPGGVIGVPDTFGAAYNPDLSACAKNGATYGGFDVTSVLNPSMSTITFALTGNESSSSGNVEFSRFAPTSASDKVQPSLEIKYNRPPFTPNPVKAFAGSDNVGCDSQPTGPYPYMGKTMASVPPVLEGSADDPDGDIVQDKFQYWVDGSSTINAVTSADLSSGSTASVSLSPSFVSGLQDGQIVDWNVATYDGQMWSNYSRTCHFIAEPTAPIQPTIASADGVFQTTTSGQVAPDIAPTDRWLLNDGGTAATAADTATTNPATLAGNAVAWTKDPTEGTVLALGDETGYAATNTPAVNTATSFSVSAWVKLTSTRTYYTAVSQGSSNVAGFYLQYNKNLNSWAFVVPASDSTSASQFIAYAASPPTLDTWTNLVGTFDATTGAVTLYVNGTAAANTAKDTSPWNATGPLAIGGVRLVGGAANNLFNGAISDVQVYASALSATDAATIATPVRTFTGEALSGTSGSFTLSTPSLNATQIVYNLDQPPATSGPPASEIDSNFTGGVAAVPAGRWKLTDGTGTTATDTGGNHPATLSASGASWTQDSSRNSQVLALNGTSGDASTSGPVATTNTSYSVSAWVKLANTNGYYTALSQAGAQVGGFYLQYNKNLNAWAIIVPAADSTSASQFIVHAATAPAINTWTQLTATIDATTGAITLYVNGVPVGTVTDTSLWNATGPLTIGAVTPTAGTASNFFNGDIADVQVYGRTLTAAEVAAMYATVTVTVTPKQPGPHSLYAYAEDAAGDTSGTSHEGYTFQATGDPADTTTCTSWAACLASKYGNTEAQTGTTSTGAGADGADSMPAADLTAAGWGNKTITVDGATFTLPVFGTGPDNVLAANQTISTPVGTNALPTTGTTSLVFLVNSTGDAVTNTNTKADLCTSANEDSAPYIPANDPTAGQYAFSGVTPAQLCPAVGTINFSDGRNPETFSLSAPDWLTGPESLAAVTLPHENTPTGQVTTNDPKIYAVSVPLKPDTTGLHINSITLPDIGIHADLGDQALHIFGIALRNTTALNTPTNTTWTGDWASPTEGDYNFNNTTIAGQTFRIALNPSLPSNSATNDALRIKFDNSLGTTPLNIGAATIGLGGTTTSATPTSTVTNLTFGGATPSSSKPVVIPEGGMLYSDTVTQLHIKPGQYVLVSFWLTEAVSVPYLPEHTWSNTAWEYTAPASTTSHAADTTASAFTGTNGSFTNVVTGLDVATPVNASTGSGTPTQIVLGDNLIDANQPNADANEQVDLAANLTTAEPTAPAAYGSIGEGIESNEITTDNPETFHGGAVGGPSALSRLDRDVLDQPGVTTVILDEGLEDILHNPSTDTKNTLENGYEQLLTYLSSYNISVVAIGLTPCAGYAGDGVTNANDPCTTTATGTTPAVDAIRTAINGWLASKWKRLVQYYIDPDYALGQNPSDTTDPDPLSTDAATTDKVNLTPAGYAALAVAYMGPFHTWQLDEASSDPTDTDAADQNDSTADTFSPYRGLNKITNTELDATLSSTGATFATDSTGRDVLSLDGQSGDAITASPAVDTAHSFTLSAWVYLTGSSLPSTDADVVSQDGVNTAAAALQYDAADQKWAFVMSTTDAAGKPLRALSQFTPTLGTWTHLVGIYNANTHTMSLYVNAAANGTVTWPTNASLWSPTGPLTIGASTQDAGTSDQTASDFFPGNLSDVQTWDYALSPDQTSALYQQLNQTQNPN
jgi:hypothetical protein